MFTFLFYFCSLYFFSLEVVKLGDPTKAYNKFLAQKAFFAQTQPLKTWSTESKNWVVANFLYLCWAFLGLFSSQWFLFLIMLIIGIIPGRTKWLYWIDALISVILILFIIINKYQLHITFF